MQLLDLVATLDNWVDMVSKFSAEHVENIQL